LPLSVFLYLNTTSSRLFTISLNQAFVDRNDAIHHLKLLFVARKSNSFRSIGKCVRTAAKHGPDMAQLQSSQEGKHPVISLTTPSPTLGLYLPLKPQQYLSPIIPAFINTTAMLVSLLKGGASTLQWDLSVTVVVIFLSAFVLTQKLTSIQSYVARSQTGEAKSSPIVPFVIPSVGTLLSFDTKEFYTKMV